MTTVNQTWIALLDSDEDDFLFWQHGFTTWAPTIDLKWFQSAESFIAETEKMETKPVAMVLDGIMPQGEEKIWLSKFLVHDCCQHIPVFILAGQYEEDSKNDYMDLGAADYLLKPNSLDELQKLVQQVSSKP